VDYFSSDDAIGAQGWKFTCLSGSKMALRKGFILKTGKRAMAAALQVERSNAASHYFSRFFGNLGFPSIHSF